MKIKSIIIIAILTINSGIADEDYFPLTVCNYWMFASTISDTVTEAIIDTQTIDSNLYYVFNQYRSYTSVLFRKVDYQIFLLSDTSEFLLYDFSADTGDSWWAPDPLDNENLGIVTLVSKSDTVTIPAGTFIDCYHFHHFLGDDYAYDEWFAPGVGLVQRNFNFFAFFSWPLISYAILSTINGTMSSVPMQYMLYQNFPNPFNLTTTIQFLVPLRSKIEIVVYDVSGRYVETLVNKEYDLGKHSIQWIGDNHHSGIYFITIIAGDVTETIKVVLVK